MIEGECKHCGATIYTPELHSEEITYLCTLLTSVFERASYELRTLPLNAEENRAIAKSHMTMCYNIARALDRVAP